MKPPLFRGALPTQTLVRMGNTDKRRTILRGRKLDLRRFVIEKP